MQTVTPLCASCSYLSVTNNQKHSFVHILYDLHRFHILLNAQ